jgi:hypothetical protein
MATMKLLTDAEVEAKPTVKAVFDGLRQQFLAGPGE